MKQAASFSLHPVTSNDDAFLLELYASTRADEMALVPWDGAQKQAFIQMQFTAQQNHYQAYFPSATHDLIVVDGQPVGRLYVDRREAEIRILDVTLLPDAREHYIGTELIHSLMKEAEAASKSLSIYVESYNRSLGLFQRLGFVKAGENGMSWLMEWHASSNQIV